MTTTAAPAKPTHNEEIKEAIPTLAGSISSTIDDSAADHFTDDDNQFLKFHGCYQQDDRDLRIAEWRSGHADVEDSPDDGYGECGVERLGHQTSVAHPQWVPATRAAR